MKSRIFLSLITLALLALSAAAVKTLNASRNTGTDAISSATPMFVYGGRDYNTFLEGFCIAPSDTHKEIVTLHLKNSVYVLLTNTARPGGNKLTDNMGRRSEEAVPLVIPFDVSNSVYQAHTEAMAKELAGLGYTVILRPFDSVHFRSMVHSGHFDVILLEKRALS